MHRSSRSAGVLAALAAVGALTVAGCGSPAENVGGAGAALPTTTAPIGGAAANLKASCAGLTVQLVPLHGAASGTTFADLVVGNPGKTACQLPARPALQYLDAAHKPIPVENGTGGPAEKPYTLSPGASAAMVIGYSSDGNPPCDAKTAYVRVSPPGAVVTFDGATHCAHDTVVEGRWVAGTYAAPS